MGINFKDIIKAGETPEQANKPMLDLLRRFNLPALIDELERVRTQRLFADVRVIDANDIEIGKIKTRYGGICQMYLIEVTADEYRYNPARPFKILTMRSIRNNGIDFGRHHKNEED